MKYPRTVLSLITGPIRVETIMKFVPMPKDAPIQMVHAVDKVILTHLQKYSRFGFMLTWPFCFHFWFFWKLQEGDDTYGWKPASEQGIYFRTPGWRWDKDLGMIPTRGYFGLHWD